MDSPLNDKLRQIIRDKKTNLAFSCDVTKRNDLVDLAKRVGEHICVLKTHIDVVEDYSRDLNDELVYLAKEHNFLLFEDRKFADIGNTVQLQYDKGIYRIADWANYVNAHAVPGDGIIDGLEATAATKTTADGRPRGLLLLAQMSSKGTLATGDYTTKVVEMAKRHAGFCCGFIGNGAVPDELRRLRALAGPEFIIMAPGVQLGAPEGKLGQQYTAPSAAIAAGADVVIVGGGIYKAADPADAAKRHKEDAWSAVRQ